MKGAKKETSLNILFIPTGLRGLKERFMRAVSFLTVSSIAFIKTEVFKNRRHIQEKFFIFDHFPFYLELCFLAFFGNHET